MRAVRVVILPDIEKALARFEELSRIMECDQVVACSFDFNEEFDRVTLILACFFALQAGAKL